MKNALEKRNNILSGGIKDYVIENVNPIICDEFLEKYNIKGTEECSEIKLGLINKEDNCLISVMTFVKPNFSKGNDKNVWKLVRFATDINNNDDLSCYEILFSYFVEEYKPDIVLSYADSRWRSILEDDINVYNMLGFKISSILAPNYSYVSAKTSYLLREDNFKYRKLNLKKLFPDTYDENLSEWENMVCNGYDRV